MTNADPGSKSPDASREANDHMSGNPHRVADAQGDVGSIAQEPTVAFHARDQGTQLYIQAETKAMSVQGGAASTLVFTPNGSPPTNSPSSKVTDRQTQSLGSLGDYELLSELGRGGMGVVYRARQRGLNRIVALKTLLPNLSLTENELLRFRNEAEAAANLRHQGIVAVYEVGEANGRHYYSMEYIEGKDLSYLIREHSLPGKEAAAYTRQLAEAVHYAHEHGVLHRDLKPANVLLDPQGNIKITDFGLAKRVHANSQLTGEFSIMGTPSYMPPEQAMPTRGPVGPYSDIYALGAVLYELLTSRPPFRADNPLETIRQVVNDDPIPLRMLNPRISPDLQTICMKCLEKEPARRYASAGELAEELHRYLSGQPILARPMGRIERLWRLGKRHPREAILSGILLVAICAGSLGVAWQWRRAETNLKTATRNFELLDKAADEMLVVVEEWVTRAPPQSDAQQEKLNSSLRLFEAFLQEEPAAQKARQRLAETHERVAEIRRLLRQLDQSAHHHREAIAIYKDLSEQSKKPDPWLVPLANAWNSLGNVAREAEQLDVAKTAFEEALQIQRSFLSSKTSPQQYGDLARTFYNRGLLRFEGNDLNAAREDFEQSIQWSDLAIEKEPNNSDFLQGSARCRINLGVLFRNEGKNGQALEQYDAAIETLRKLNRDVPTRNEYAVELAQSQLNLGNLFLASRNNTPVLSEDPLREAQRSFEEAILLLTKLTNEYPSVPQYRIQLANALNGLGGVQQEAGKLEDARNSWTLARQEFRDILRLSGDSAEVRSRLGLTLSNLALLIPSDQSQLRIPLLLEACEHQRAALTKTPQAKAIQTYLRSHLISLSRAYSLSGSHAQGVITAEEIATLPWNREDGRVAAELIVRAMNACEQDIALTESLQTETTNDYARRAIAVLRQAISKDPKVLEQLQNNEKLAALKTYPEFQLLIQELEGNHSIP